MITTQELYLSKIVTGSSELTQQFTPASGSEVVVRIFSGSAVFSANARVAIVWKYNHATESEEIIWQITGEQPMPAEYTIPTTDTDGVRKLALVLSNSGLTDVALSGYARITEKL